MTVDERTTLLDLLWFVAKETWTKKIPKGYVEFAGEIYYKVKHDLDHYRRICETIKEDKPNG